MKTILTVFILIASLYTYNVTQEEKLLTPEKTYCDGWDDGYEDGYCSNIPMGCTPPVTPTCPLAKAGQDKYKDGYARGLKKGNKKWEDENKED